MDSNNENITTSREFYEFYKNNRLHKSKHFNEYKYFNLASAKLFRTLYEFLPLTESGLYIENFMYIYAEVKECKTKPNVAPNTDSVTTKKLLRKIKFEFLYDINEKWEVKANKIFSNHFMHNQKYRKEEIELLTDVTLHNNRIKYLHKNHRLFEQN